MNTKTMEGLAGAGTNMKIMQTPMRVFKEASRRGDIATMERAGGYACEFADRTEKYKSLADEGMEEEIREAREEKAREEKERKTTGTEMPEKASKTETEAYQVEISEEGKALLEKEEADNESKRIQSGCTGNQTSAGE